MVAKHGTPAEQKTVRSAVHSKYPSISKEASYLMVEKLGGNYSVKINGQETPLTPEQSSDVDKQGRNILLGLGLGGAIGGVGGYYGTKLLTRKKPLNVLGGLLGASILAPYAGLYAWTVTKTPELDKLRGSLNKKASAMSKGLKVEKEHEDTIKWLVSQVAPNLKVTPTMLKATEKNIVKDHLKERGDYYDGLELVEKLPSSEIKSLRKQHKLT